jgi:hypothetical protein
VSARLTRVGVAGALVLWAACTSVNARLGSSTRAAAHAAEVGRVALDLAWSGELARHFLTSLGRVARASAWPRWRRSASACWSACACRCA